MKAYTLGFIFNHDLSGVVLMHKNRPDWQAGKLNGVGGKIEPGEESVACIAREVLEETGVDTQKADWVYFGEIKADDWRVDLYTLVYFGTQMLSTTTDEEVEWFKVGSLPDNIIENLKWIIPLAIYKLENRSIKSCLVEYV